MRAARPVGALLMPSSAPRNHDVVTAGHSRLACLWLGLAEGVLHPAAPAAQLLHPGPPLPSVASQEMHLQAQLAAHREAVGAWEGRPAQPLRTFNDDSEEAQLAGKIACEVEWPSGSSTRF